MTDTIELYFYEPDDSIGRDILVKTLKYRFPGSYEIEFKDSPKFTITIHFTDPEEATLFRIKGWI